MDLNSVRTGFPFFKYKLNTLISRYMNLVSVLLTAKEFVHIIVGKQCFCFSESVSIKTLQIQFITFFWQNLRKWKKKMLTTFRQQTLIPLNYFVFTFFRDEKCNRSKLPILLINLKRRLFRVHLIKYTMYISSNRCINYN